MAHILVADVAKRYPVSHRTVLRMIERGELPIVEKLGWDRTGPYVLDSADVDAFFANRVRTPEPFSAVEPPAA